MTPAIVSDTSSIEYSRDKVWPSYDAQFIARLRQGDTDAFDQLVKREGPRITKLVSRLLSWSSECDDVVQDVFIACWESIERFRGGSDLSTWLYSIAINRCRNHQRGRRVWDNCFRKVCDLWNAHQQQQSGPHRNMPDLEEVQEAIEQLPHRDRELIVLICLEQVPVETVGTMLGIRKNTLDVRLHRARQRLKKILSLETDE